MSRSYLKSKWMQKKLDYHSSCSPNRTSYKHRRDEEPKNGASKYITMHCRVKLVEWLQESTSFGGHSIPKGGHRRVSGLVRASVKRETQKEIETQMNEDDKV